MKYSVILILVLTGLLAGCATEYHPLDGDKGGYSEAAIGPGVWRVKIHSTPYTMRRQVADFLLLRSAELTLLQGYSQFALVEHDLASSEVHMFHAAQQGRTDLHDAHNICSKLGEYYQVTCR